MELGYRESTESRAGVLRDLRARGLGPPLLVVGDGALGLLAALDEVFPTTEHQRCWNHCGLNVQERGRELDDVGVGGLRVQRRPAAGAAHTGTDRYSGMINGRRGRVFHNSCDYLPLPQRTP